MIQQVQQMLHMPKNVAGNLGHDFSHTQVDGNVDGAKGVISDVVCDHMVVWQR